MKSSFLLILAVLVSAGAAANQTLNQIVAVVNDEVITASELETREQTIVDQLREQNAELPSRSLLRKQVLDRLILENLQLQMAEKSGIRVDDENLNASLRQLAEQNNMSLSEFRQVLESEGYDYIAFREQFRDQIVMNRLRQQMVDSRVQVSEREIDSLLETAAANNIQNREYRLAHILVSVPDAATPDEVSDAEERANGILQRLREGENFETLAISESDGQQALNGGDLGWRKSGQLPSFFSDVVGDLQAGDISDLIRSPSGFHIIQVVDIRGDTRHVIKQTRAAHILIRADALVSEDEARTRTEQLYERVLQGEDFNTLARANSQDPGSASEGGDLGWVTPGAMVPEFEKAMDALSPGQVSAPVESRFGWHLIKVVERRNYDDTEKFRRARARESLRELKTSEELEIWLRRLRDESYIEYHIGES